MVMFLEPPVQLMLAALKSEPTAVVSMEAMVTVVEGRPAMEQQSFNASLRES